TANQTNVLVGSLSGISGPTGGMLGLGRFYVQLSGTNPIARVKLYVAARGSAQKAQRKLRSRQPTPPKATASPKCSCSGAGCACSGKAGSRMPRALPAPQ